MNGHSYKIYNAESSPEIPKFLSMLIALSARIIYLLHIIASSCMETLSSRRLTPRTKLKSNKAAWVRSNKNLTEAIINKKKWGAQCTIIILFMASLAHWLFKAICKELVTRRRICEKSRITLCEKSHCEFAIAVSRETGSSNTLNKIANRAYKARADWLNYY